MNNECDIAIVGMACRFPGAQSLQAFWQNLINGVESITRFSDRELLDAGVSPEFLSRPDYVKAAPVLDDRVIYVGNWWAGNMYAIPIDPPTTPTAVK